MPKRKHVSLDPLIHQPVRLHIMAALHALAPNQEIEFTTLRDLLGLTDGNLLVHLRKLEEAGYISMTKAVVERKQRTYISMERAGRKAFEAYLHALQTLLPLSSPPASSNP